MASALFRPAPSTSSGAPVGLSERGARGSGGDTADTHAGWSRAGQRSGEQALHDANAGIGAGRVEFLCPIVVGSLDANLSHDRPAAPRLLRKRSVADHWGTCPTRCDARTYSRHARALQDWPGSFVDSVAWLGIARPSTSSQLLSVSYCASTYEIALAFFLLQTVVRQAPALRCRMCQEER